MEFHYIPLTQNIYTLKLAFPYAFKRCKSINLAEGSTTQIMPWMLQKKYTFMLFGEYFFIESHKSPHLVMHKELCSVDELPVSYGHVGGCCN